jgi:16S rRNA G1207 methylase RsmC
MILNFYPFPMVFHNNVDVNGVDFARQITKYIKKNYLHGCYFCCGQGAVGFNLLHNQQAEYMTFIDCYQPALDSCKLTAKINNWQNQCKFLPSLTSHDLIDIFIADPPWWPTVLPGPELSPHVVRQYFDIDYEIHKSMWTWLTDHLAPNGDIFLVRDNTRNNLDQWNALIPKNFKIVDEHKLKFFIGRKNTVKIVDSSVLVHVQRC